MSSDLIIVVLLGLPLVYFMSGWLYCLLWHGIIRLWWPKIYYRHVVEGKGGKHEFLQD